MYRGILAAKYFFVPLCSQVEWWNFENYTTTLVSGFLML